VGSGVLDGDKIGVAEAAGVSVKESVGVSCGDDITETVVVDVWGVNEFVGNSVSTAPGIDAKLQAAVLRINRLRKKVLGFIDEIASAGG
jgi:hypothetical protein